MADPIAPYPGGAFKEVVEERELRSPPTPERGRSQNQRLGVERSYEGWNSEQVRR